MVDVTVNMANPSASAREFMKQRNHELIPKKLKEKKYFLNKQQMKKLKEEAKRKKKNRR